MSICSLGWLGFFPLVALLFWLMPPRLRSPWLLVVSLCFVATWGLSSLLALLGVTLISWLAGRALAAAKAPWARRAWLVLGLAGSAGWLFVRKLIGLAAPEVSLIAAAGLAFYSLQAASYLVDIFRGQTPVQKSLWRYALFVSFFPRLISGPIGRAEEFFPQLEALSTKKFDATHARDGLAFMLWGYFQKLALADTLGLVTDSVFDNYATCSGPALLFGVVAFGFSLYADFAGYSCIAIGGAKVLGLQLSENFRQPYLSVSMREFWRRWHISLSSWLRDYIYIPLGGNRCGKGRKAFNLLLTFLVSGLWHGTGWQYLFWGLQHAVYQLFGNVTAPLRAKLRAALPGRGERGLFLWMRRLSVLLLADSAWLFFRAPSVLAGFAIVQGIFSRWSSAAFTDGSLLTLGLNGTQLIFVALAFLVVLTDELLAESGSGLHALTLKLSPLLRGFVWLLLAAAVLLFACWQIGGNAADFYYARF